MEAGKSKYLASIAGEEADSLSIPNPARPRSISVCVADIRWEVFT
jgi:hypothetical protein